MKIEKEELQKEKERAEKVREGLVAKGFATFSLDQKIKGLQRAIRDFDEVKQKEAWEKLRRKIENEQRRAERKEDDEWMEEWFKGNREKVGR